MGRGSPHLALATGAGLVAIVFWSSTFALARTVAEQLGVLTAGASFCLLGGLLGCVYAGVFAGALGKLRRLSLPHQAGRGALFVAYEVCLFLAVGLAASRQQVLEVSIINYLWPGLTLVFSIPILRHRARWPLLVGISVALAGVGLATIQGHAFSWEALGKNLRYASLPYLLALVAAVCWALFTNLSRRWAQRGDYCAVPVFVLATGLLLGALTRLLPESPTWSLRVGGEVVYMAVFPTMLAFLLWNFAVQKGHMILLASLSHLTPLLAMIVSCLYLRVAATPGLWIACGLVVAGAAICKMSMVPETDDS